MFPAAWLDQRFADATGDRLYLQDVEGSVWNGSAELVLGQVDEPQASRALPGRFQWHMAWTGLLHGRVEILLSNSQVLKAPLTISIGHALVAMGADGIRLPLALLYGLGAPFNSLGLQGTIVCDWTSWQIGSSEARGHAEVRLIDLASAFSTVRPLGSYLATFDGMGSSTALKVVTQEGPLLIDAVGNVNALGLSLSGHARAQPDAQERLADLLGVLGHVDQGVVAFSFGTSN